jgi:HD-GYP domain-containing protein (c-di-GMP phosphodiesterase class II)
MRSDSISDNWKDAINVAPVDDRYRLRLDVGRLRRGLFVAELDRPWLDTPFLIHGFLVDSDIELKTLQRYCRHVFVDTDRSDPATIGKILERMAIAPEPSAQVVGHAQPVHGDALAETTEPDTLTLSQPPAACADLSRPPAARRAYKVRADVQISRETRERFRSLVRDGAPSRPGAESETLARRALARVRGLFGSGNARGGDVDAGRRALPPEVTKLLAPGTRAAFYADRHDPATELPRARRVFEQCDGALRAVIADIRAGRVPKLAPVGDAVAKMIDSVCDNPDALLWVAQMREEHGEAYQPGVRVALYLVTFGRQLGLPRASLAELGMIGILADVGKVRLPRALLEKPGMLNPAEYSIIKEHVRLGLEALSPTGALGKPVERGIAEHHERLDGSGYPKGLSGDEISLFGRMAAIADCFAALSAPRAYANPLAAQDALMNLYQWADTSFQGVLVEQFVQAIGVFPVGSLIELSSGEVAVVVAHNRAHHLEPRVLLLTWPDKRGLPTPVEIDLAQRPQIASGKPLRAMRGLPSSAYGLKLRDYYADGSSLALAKG